MRTTTLWFHQEPKFETKFLIYYFAEHQNPMVLRQRLNGQYFAHYSKLQGKEEWLKIRKDKRAFSIFHYEIPPSLWVGALLCPLFKVLFSIL